MLSSGISDERNEITGNQKYEHYSGSTPKTVIAAYEELDAQGWVETIPNKGTFVIESGTTKTLI